MKMDVDTRRSRRISRVSFISEPFDFEGWGCRKKEDMGPFLWVSITCSHSFHPPPPRNMEDQGLKLSTILPSSFQSTPKCALSGIPFDSPTSFSGSHQTIHSRRVSSPSGRCLKGRNLKIGGCLSLFSPGDLGAAPSRHFIDLSPPSSLSYMLIVPLSQNNLIIMLISGRAVEVFHFITY